MNNTSKVRIGIIGTGVGLRTHYPGFMRTGEAEIIGIVGSTQNRANEFAAKFNIPNSFGAYQDLFKLDNLDLVCVTTPNDRHFEEILYTLKNGVNVIAEKPLAMNIGEIDELIAASESSNKFAVIDHQLRFNPYIRKVKELLRDKIGRPYFIRIHQQSIGFSDKNAKWNWSFDDTKGGGVRLAMASHLIDLIQFWFENPTIYEVKGAMDAVVTQRVDNNNMIREVTASSFFSANLSVQNNLDIQISATAAAYGVARFDFSVYGTEGEVHFDLVNKLSGSFSDSRAKLQKIEVEGVTPEEQENKVSIFSGSFVYYAPKIIECVKSGDFNKLSDATNFKDAKYNQTVLDAILNSSKTGRSINLNKGFTTNSII